MMLGQPSPQFSWSARWLLQFQISCPYQVRGEEEGALGSCIHFISERKAFPMPLAEVLLSLISQYCQLTICPSLATRKVAKQKGFGNDCGVSQNHSSSHTQLSGHSINILSPAWSRGDKTPIMTEIPSSTTQWDTMGLRWISKKPVKTKYTHF